MNTMTPEQTAAFDAKLAAAYASQTVRELREQAIKECPAGCDIPEHEHYAEPNDGCTITADFE